MVRFGVVGMASWVRRRGTEVGIVEVTVVEPGSQLEVQTSTGVVGRLWVGVVGVGGVMIVIGVGTRLEGHWNGTVPGIEFGIGIRAGVGVVLVGNELKAAGGIGVVGVGVGPWWLANDVTKVPTSQSSRLSVGSSDSRSSSADLQPSSRDRHALFFPYSCQNFNPMSWLSLRSPSARPLAASSISTALPSSAVCSSEVEGTDIGVGVSTSERSFMSW